MDIKKFLRGTALYILGAGLFFSLFVLAYFLVFNRITGNPERLKHILSDSGVYRQIPAVVYDDAVNSDSTSSVSIPLKDAAVRKVALETFTPDFIQKNVENLIDGTYVWLDGKTPQPEFTIDLKDTKDRFAKSLAKTAAERLKHLPPCKSGQFDRSQEFDALTAPCLPPGTDIKAALKKVRTDAAGSDNFLEQTTISPATIKDADGKPVFDNYSDVPKAFQLAMKLPYFTMAACLLLATAIVFVSVNRRDGLKRLGKILVISGVFVILLPVGINHLIGSALDQSPDDRVTTQVVTPIINELNKVSSKVYFTVGAVYILLAVGAFFLINKLPEPAKAKRKK